MDGNALEKIGTGRIIATITSGDKTWIDGIIHVLQEGTKMIIISGYIVYLFFSESFFAWLVFILVFISLHICIIYIDTFAHKYRKIRTEKKTELTRELVRIVMARNEILQSGRTNSDTERVISIANQMESANNEINKALFIIFNLVRLTASGVRLAIILFLIYAQWASLLTTADIAGILALLIVFENFLFNSTEFYKNFTKDFTDIEKLWRMFDDAPQMKGYSTWKPFSPKNQNIQINNLSYGYNDTKVFSDFSLTIEKGKKTALVWASGGGKTTLMKLIAGYLHPESWNISVMGNVLAETALKSYYPHIGYLTQDPWVFDATIRENLVSAIAEKKTDTQTVTQRNVSVIAKNEAIQVPEKKSMDRFVPRDDETQELEQKLHEALRLAQCDFVFDLEKWLDTEIGERGVRLSGGQKQRLAIAKIFLKNPEIILLDEPTSALDSFSEERITEALDTLFEGRTVIIIAHRLQTVKRADDIIVIEWWQVVERWTHTSLTREKWVSHKMLELQSGF